MPQDTAEARILKITAAQRQLDAGIRMSLNGDDPLAITTVAAAALQVLKDLKEKRGGDVLKDHYFDTFVGTVRAIVRGEVPAEQLDGFKKDPEFWGVMGALIQFVQLVGADKTMSELENLVTIRFSEQHAQEHWRAFNRAPNFLKHANRDWNTSLVESDANPEHVIRSAVLIYLDLMDYLTPEMQVWFVFQCVSRDMEFMPEDKP